MASRAAAIAPDMPQLFELRAYLALVHGNLGDALKDAEAMVARNPNSADGQYLLGQMHFFAGEYGRAITALSAAERLNPNNRASYSAHMAFAHLALGQSDVAITILENVVYRWPDYSPGRAYLAILYRLAGREAEAREQADLHARMAPVPTVDDIELRFSPMHDRKLAEMIADAARRAGLQDKTAADRPPQP